MSLVLEALRRVEKATARPGSVGVAVSSYRPAHRHRSIGAPLVLGLVTGAVLLYLWRAEPQAGRRGGGGEDLSSRPPSGSMTGLPGAADAASPEAPGTTRSVSGSEREPALRQIEEPASDSRPLNSPKPPAPPSPSPARPPLVLQAISERDSRPIAVINDQLVREGDVLGGVRILRIGAESVEVLDDRGTNATIRFAPPPPLSPSLPRPAPEASPESF